MNKYFNFIGEFTKLSTSPLDYATNAEINVQRSGDVILFNSLIMSYLDNKNQWIFMNGNAFPYRPGQSCTPIDGGFAFFGGHFENGGVTNELWIFRNDVWSPLINDIKGRKYHGALYLPEKQSLLISGGTDGKVVFDDMVLINLVTFDITNIVLNEPIKIMNHAVLNMNDSKICIFGGANSELVTNQTIFIVDLETKNVEKIETVTPFSLTYPYNVILVEDLLITVNSHDSRADLWIFDLTFSVWLKIDFKSLFPKLGYIFPDKNGFTFLDKCLAFSLKVTYKDIYHFKGALITSNIKNSIYKINEEEQLVYLEKLLNIHKESLKELKNLSSTPINKNAIDVINIEEGFIKIKKYQLKIDKMQKLRIVENQKKSNQSDTIEKLLKSLEEIHKERKHIKSDHKQFIVNPTENIQGYNYYHIYYAPHELLNYSGDTALYLNANSAQISDKIKSQTIEIQNLEKQLEIEKKKSGKFYDSYNILMDELDRLIDFYQSTLNEYKLKYNQFLSSEIRLNNFNLKLLNSTKMYNMDEIDKFSNANYDNYKLKKAFNKNLSFKEKNIAEMKENLNSFINKLGTASVSEIDCLCKKITKSINDISNLVDENSIILEDSSLLMDIENKYTKQLPLQKDETNDDIKIPQNWDELSNDVLDILQSLEKNNLLS